MVYQLTVPVALAEDLNWVLSTHVEWLTNTCNPRSKWSDILSLPPWSPTPTCACIKIHTHKEKGYEQ